MEQLDMLWEYQKLDMQMDKMEAEFRISSIRNDFAKVHNFLKEYQNSSKQLEIELGNKMSDFEASQKKIAEMENHLQMLRSQFDPKAENTLETLEKLRREGAKVVDFFTAREKELAQLAESMDAQQANLDDLRGKVAKAKNEYEPLKEKYNQGVEQLKEKTTPVQAERDLISKKIEAHLLQTYKNIKKNKPMPLAKVIAGQCSGCNMELAALQLRKVKTEKKIIECENCGRLLYFV